jgi:putative Mn2+ efflux pump MntP
MDTFSVSLSIGTFNINKSKIIIITILVGIMHFIMPIIGSILGNKITIFLNINVHLLLGIILLFIAIQMVNDLFKEDNKELLLNILNIFLISISVSLDSFSIGLGLKAITNNNILSGFIFSICASSLTFLGFLIGKYSSKKLGIIANILGIIILFILSIIHLFK